jgi:nitrous oxidase accessory protein
VRIWEVRESRIENNHLEDSRDVVVWYSSGNRIAGNTVVRGRYGTHLMYSHDNTLEGNHYDGNVVGIFLMYSRNVALLRNQLLRSSGAAGMGIGLKESEGIRVEENLFAGNQVCVYTDTSPLSLNQVNRFERNWFRSCGSAIVFHGGAERNYFVGNSFRDNAAQVRVEGRGDAQQASWRGNDFDDYAGYDLDGDGVGDLPYELRSLSGDLTGRHPSIAFFRGAPAMALVELVGRVVPLFRPTTILTDSEPRMRPHELPRPDAS